jgi:hypothetical protein
VTPHRVPILPFTEGQSRAQPSLGGAEGAAGGSKGVQVLRDVISSTWKGLVTRTSTGLTVTRPRTRCASRGMVLYNNNEINLHVVSRTRDARSPCLPVDGATSAHHVQRRAGAASVPCVCTRARRGCPTPRAAEVPLAIEPHKPRPPAQLPPPPAVTCGWALDVVGSVGETSACERLRCVWRCAVDLSRAAGGQRLCAHIGSSCTSASSASSDTPVGVHHSGAARHSGGMRAGACARATGVHPPATAA